MTHSPPAEATTPAADPSSTPTVLVVEDDHVLRGLVAKALRAHGFDVVTASDGDSALRSAVRTRVDAVVLDVGLPDSDGRDVCQAMRSRGVDAPVLFLTAKHSVTDRLSGFASGGDDYLTKPFALPELVARLHALVRRHVIGSAPPSSDGLVIDPIRHSARVGEAEVDLSPTEFRLLARLAAAAGGVVRRAQLREAAWPHEAFVSDNTLDQYVSKLRRKLTELGAAESIRSARGVGFQLIARTR